MDDRSARPTGLAASRTVAVKRLLDRTLSAAALLLLAPVFALIAALVRAGSPGPVFFTQHRVGQGGRLFRLYKFRTMVENAAHIGLGENVSSDDDRITQVGKALRRTSLDELPQLINILLGDMSLVGPRPTLPDHVRQYTPRQRRRLEAKPGLTGWAQVNGRNSLSWDERIELDIWYVDHWSPELDIRILARTPMAVLAKEGVYGVNGVTKDFGEQ